MNNQDIKQAQKFYNRVWFYFALCLIVFLFGGLFTPGEWYQALNRAPWSPPNLAFPIVWAILYVMIAFVGHKTALSGNIQLRRLWFTQLLLNGIWSWLFFGQHWVLAGLLNLSLLLLAVAVFIYQCLKRSMISTVLLMLPYFLWLCLAASLNAYIVLYN